MEPIGYDLVASCIDSERDLALYRRFGVLNARNLLYLQSELMALEERLKHLDGAANDRNKGVDTWSIPRSWYHLEKENREHLEVVLKIRDRLEMYNRALASQAWLLGLKKPSKQSWMNLAEFMRTNRSSMSEADAQFISAVHRSDMVALAQGEKELISHLIERHISWIFDTKEPRFHSGEGYMSYYSDSKISGFIRLLAIVFSSVMPVLSIVGLYYIRSQTARLGCVVAFSALCSAVLATFTNARTVEIIAASAAYAAVQVVFVSGNISN